MRDWKNDYAKKQKRLLILLALGFSAGGFSIGTIVERLLDFGHL